MYVQVYLKLKIGAKRQLLIVGPSVQIFNIAYPLPFAVVMLFILVLVMLQSLKSVWMLVGFSAHSIHEL